MRGIFCALAAVLLAAAWADHDHNHLHIHDHNDHLHVHDHNDHHHGSNHSHEGELSCHKLSTPNADLAFALYKHMRTNTTAGKNIFFSPLGISAALSMLSAGAGGETHSQLFSSLGYSALNQTQVDEAYEHLFHMLGHSQEDQQLNVGNAVAVRSGFNPVATYQNNVRHHYSGEVFDVDLTRPADAAAEINRFIANKTHDMIKDMVKDLDPDMLMVLINYVYFKAQWKSPFRSDFTSKDTFFLTKSTKIYVEMMLRLGDYETYWDTENHTTVIMLPYNGTTTMMVVLPDEGKMKEVEEYISKDHIHHWRNSASMQYVSLFLPKFSISTDASLEDILKHMGITNAFGDNADFSGMSEDFKLKVSKVSHKAMLSVTEKGTEAGAVTISELITVFLPPTIRVDRPFLVFILEDSTKSILFMGKINNPTAM